MTSDGGEAAAPLLGTKVHAPARRPGTVARPRLTERVTAGRLPALTVVAAPAGFGKTTLLTEWFAGSGAGAQRTAWLALDPGDNDPAAFWPTSWPPCRPWHPAPATAHDRCCGPRNR